MSGLQKYRASHIVTFGSMAAKMAIKDVARVLKLELSGKPVGKDGAGNPENHVEEGLQGES